MVKKNATKSLKHQNPPKAKSLYFSFGEIWCLGVLVAINSS
jgi:hypothetical protein